MLYKCQNHTLEAGRPKQDQMGVIQSNENKHEKTFLDDNYKTNHNTINFDKNDQNRKEITQQEVTKVRKSHKSLRVKCLNVTENSQSCLKMSSRGKNQASTQSIQQKFKSTLKYKQ